MVAGSVLMGLLLFQNCEVSSSPKSKVPQKTSTSGQIYGNGEGYAGKQEFARYDLNNQCGNSDTGDGLPDILDQITRVNNDLYLTRENCQDIEPRPITRSGFDQRDYNPEHAIYSEGLFQSVDDVINTNMVTQLLCRGEGNMDGVNGVDFLIQKNYLTGELFMTYFMVFYEDMSRDSILWVDEQTRRPAIYEFRYTDYGATDFYSAFINEENGYMQIELFRDNSTMMGDGWFYMTRNKALDGVMYNCY